MKSYNFHQHPLWTFIRLCTQIFVISFCLLTFLTIVFADSFELGEPPRFPGDISSQVILELQKPIVSTPAGFFVDPKSREESTSFFNTYYRASEGHAIEWTGSHAACNAGEIAVDFRDAVLLRLNYFRAMAGVPSEIVLYDVYNSKAQKTALIMSVNDSLSHFPPTSWQCYSADGAEAAGKSNLCLGCFGWDAITMYMKDPGAGNYFVGHRRWILYPQTQMMGAGDIPSASNYPSSNALWVFDSNIFGPRPLTREEFVSWPPPGYVPYQVVFPRWSFSYPSADFSVATVTMTSEGYTISADISPIANGYGENTIVWIPMQMNDWEVWPKPQRDTNFSVLIENVFINGIRQSFQYDVTVFDPEDNDLPIPNPMTWATQPYAGSSTSISMVATTAMDANSPPVSYYFDFVDTPTGGTGGADSGWQSATSYMNAGLEVNHQYGYRVKARDGVNNETAYSTPTRYAYTAIEVPSGITIGTVTSTSIQVQSTNNPSGLTRGSSGLLIENTTNVTSSGWRQNNTFWTSNPLTPNTSYSFRAKARNGDGVETGYTSTVSKYTLADAPGTASFSNITQTSIRANWTANGNPVGTQYWCENTTQGTNSGWTTNSYWNETGLTCGTSYAYRVKAKNGDGIETGWTNLGSQITQACSISFVSNTDSVTVPEGGTAQFQVKLSAQPASTVYASVSRVSGDSDINVQSGSSLTFTSTNWNTYQTVTLSAAEDADTTNGTATIRISASGIPNKDITATESDNDPSVGISYTINPNASYAYIYGDNQITSWEGSLNDGYFDLSLGDFDFYFYGMPVSSVRISTNGYITFGTNGTDFSNVPIPNVNSPNAIMAPFWDDLDLTGLSGERGVWWGIFGTAPNRQLVIEWYQIPSFEHGTETYSFEVILYESTDRIKFQYLDVDSGTNHDLGASATVGIENFDGTDGEHFSYNTASLRNGLAIEFIPSGIPNPLNDTTEFVKQQYRDFLNREAEPGGLQYWVNMIDSEAMTRAQVIESFFWSDEFGARIAPIVRLYFAYFLRIPDYGGLMYWINVYKSGGSLGAISDAFAGSEEFQQTYGSLSNEGFVNLIYQNILGRAPDPGGYAFWVGELNLGRQTRGQVMIGFSESAEYIGLTFNEVFVTMMYIGMLRRAPEQGGFDWWVDYLDSGNSGLALIDGFLNSQEYADRFQ